MCSVRKESDDSETETFKLMRVKSSENKTGIGTREITKYYLHDTKIKYYLLICAKAKWHTSTTETEGKSKLQTSRKHCIEYVISFLKCKIQSVIKGKWIHQNRLREVFQILLYIYKSTVKATCGILKRSAAFCVTISSAGMEITFFGDSV